jgi:hypothetical protein
VSVARDQRVSGAVIGIADANRCPRAQERPPQLAHPRAKGGVGRHQHPRPHDDDLLGIAPLGELLIDQRLCTDQLGIVGHVALGGQRRTEQRSRRGHRCSDDRQPADDRPSGMPRAGAGQCLRVREAPEGGCGAARDHGASVPPPRSRHQPEGLTPGPCWPCSCAYRPALPTGWSAPCHVASMTSVHLSRPANNEYEEARRLVVEGQDRPMLGLRIAPASVEGTGIAIARSPRRSRGTGWAISAMLVNRLTGQTREVDVVLRATVGGHETVVAVQATSGTQPAPVDWVEGDDLQAQQPADRQARAVSEAGFSMQARTLAEKELPTPRRCSGPRVRRLGRVAR